MIARTWAGSEATRKHPTPNSYFGKEDSNSVPTSLVYLIVNTNLANWEKRKLVPFSLLNQ